MKPKSRSGTKKRVKVTGSGKLVMKKSGRGHLLKQKSARAKKAVDKPMVLSGANARNMKAMLPHI